ncbi:MAG: DUF2490 domain-containing protein [Fluviicola sp.]|nr:DUF2490 domain-containing protein [Fluviicola sp.]
MKLIISIFLLALSHFSFSQKPTDTELWTGAGVKVKLSKRAKITFEQQFRFNDTVSSLNAINSDLGLKIKANKFLSFKATARYSSRPNKKNRARIALDANVRLSKKGMPLAFIYRLRLQDTEVLNSNKRASIVRNKIGLEYNASKLVDPYVAYEIYFRFNGRNEFRTTRFTAGLDWRLAKPLKLTTFYRLQSDINIKAPERSHIIGVALTWSINAKKKQKKNSSSVN